MSDEIIEHEEDQDPTEEETDFDGAFSEVASESVDKSGEIEDEDKDEKTEEIEGETEEEKAAKEEAAEKLKKADEDAKKKAGAAEEKDDELPESEEDKRGKEILVEEEKAKKKAETEAEQAQKEAEEKKKIEEAGKVKPFTGDDIKTFSQIISEAELPESIEIAEGVDVDVKEYLRDFPAVQPVVAMIMQKVLKNLLDNGMLITSKTFNQETEGFKTALRDLNFNNAVYRLAPEVELKDETGGVIGKERMDVDVVLDSPEFKAWLDKAPNEHKALFRGGPKDFVLGLKKFSDSLKVEDAKKKVAESDGKAKKKKDEHDDVHLHTVRKKSKGEGGEDEVDDDDFDSAFKEAAGKKKR